MSLVIQHNNIDSMKMKYQKTYSEDLFDIPHAPKHQCPDIDYLVKAIRSIEKITNKSHRMDEDELRSAMDDIERELWNFESNLESVRTACEELRDWGQGWKDLFKSTVNQFEQEDIDKFI